MKIGYTKCKQVITNYIAAKRIPKPNSIADIDLNNVIFKEEDGTPLITILDHSKGLLIMSQSQARLVAQYQDFIFFDGTFKVTPSLYYQLCLFIFMLNNIKLQF